MSRPEVCGVHSRGRRITKARQRYARSVGRLQALLILIGISPLSMFPNETQAQVLRSREHEEGHPPIANRVPKIDTLHGDVRVDEYYWLRNRSDPEVIDYLEAENRYAEKMMADAEDLQDHLYREFLSRIKETDLSVPARWGDYQYYSRSEEGEQYRIYCRKRASLKGNEEILLDQNELAKGFDYYAVGFREISRDHRYLAYSADTLGAERYTLFIKDLASGELLPEKIENVGYGVAWSADCSIVFYTTLNEARRPHKVYRHVVGTDPVGDVLVYEENDEAFWISCAGTRSGEYILITTSSWTSSEVLYLPSDEPTGVFEPILPREPGIEYYVEHCPGSFFMMTNDSGSNFRLLEAADSSPQRGEWVEAIPHRDSVRIDSLDGFGEHLVVYERRKGLKQIRVVDLADRQEHCVDFPEAVYTFWRAWNPEFDSRALRFVYESLVTPSSVFDYDMETREWELRKRYEVLGGYDPDLYESERVFAEASDGRSIPISLVYRRGIPRDGSSACYLVGYGAYGSSSEPYFSSIRLSLLERGFTYGIAHIRGGGEMGRVWHEEGRLLQKMNTFTDFIACAEELIREGYTSTEKLVITGASAGGLLIGAVVNMRPDLFKVAVADVPFVDVINTMLDASLPLTVLEWEEWGNPSEREYYEYMVSYSPYENVSAQRYPVMLITSALSDTRVAYWEAAKWTARLRAMKSDDHMLLLRTDMQTGHLGASGRYDYLRERAFEYAFVFRALGIE